MIPKPSPAVPHSARSPRTPSTTCSPSTASAPPHAERRSRAMPWWVRSRWPQPLIGGQDMVADEVQMRLVPVVSGSRWARGHAGVQQGVPPVGEQTSDRHWPGSRPRKTAESESVARRAGAVHARGRRHRKPMPATGWDRRVGGRRVLAQARAVTVTPSSALEAGMRIWAGSCESPHQGFRRSFLLPPGLGTAHRASAASAPPTRLM